MKKRRVVITGMGAVTPLGHDVEQVYANVVAGKSGVAPIVGFDASRFPTKFAAQCKDFNLARHLPPDAAKHYADVGLNSRFALAAGREALIQAGLLDCPKVNRERFRIYLGAGEGMHEFETFVSLIAQVFNPKAPLKQSIDEATFIERGLTTFNPAREYELEMNTTIGHLGRYFNILGPNSTCLTACAASSQAIGEAMWQIRYGDCDVMLVGGTHSMIHPLGLTGFNLLTALSTHNEEPTKASRPFDRKRDGFVLGEGAGMLIIEELEHAKKRGATILAELTGYGTTGDAFRVTDSHSEGRGAIACIEMALKDSARGREEIDYINAHGTSTQVNDKVETLAVKKVFGEGAYGIPISSNKSMLGHLIAAAGAVELIISVKTILNGVMPPTINYEYPDPECDLDYIPNVAREKRVENVLSNSFGFGGQNISLIVSRFTD